MAAISKSGSGGSSFKISSRSMAVEPVCMVRCTIAYEEMAKRRRTLPFALSQFVKQRMRCAAPARRRTAKSAAPCPGRGCGPRKQHNAPRLRRALLIRIHEKRCGAGGQERCRSVTASTTTPPQICITGKSLAVLRRLARPMRSAARSTGFGRICNSMPSDLA